MGCLSIAKLDEHCDSVLPTPVLQPSIGLPASTGSVARELQAAKSKPGATCSHDMISNRNGPVLQLPKTLKQAVQS